VFESSLRRRSRSLVVALSLSLLLLAACSPSFHVTSPQAGQTSSQEFSVDKTTGIITINVTFTQDVDLSTVQPRVNVQLVMETDANAPFSAALQPGDAKVLVITSDGSAGDLCNFDPDCHFSLKILGSGSSPVKSASGTALDGDANGSAGGDYSTSFTLIG
jgi:hypothetical protein